MRAGHRFLAWLQQAVEPLRIKVTRGDTRDLKSRMCHAIKDHDAEAVRYFLKHGFDPNLSSLPFPFKDTLLHTAVVARAPVEIFDLLLKAGADPHVLDKWAWSKTYDNPQPAALKQMDELVRAMGKTPKPWRDKISRTYKGRTPRELAESMNLTEIAARLKLAENPEKLPSLESRQHVVMCPVLEEIGDRLNKQGSPSPKP